MKNERRGDISVVVQGPVDARLTPRCLAGARRHLPGAELILSTWRGTDVSGLDADRVVLNDDPGAVACTAGDNPIFYNVNRQIVSTLGGLRAASRPTAVKMRSDMEITGTGFLDLFEEFPVRSAEWRVMERRIVGCTVPSQSVRRRGLSLSPSDWFHFGRTDDLLKLWDVPLDADGSTAQHFDNRPRPVPDRLPEFRCRFLPEQYVWLNCLAKVRPIDMAHLGDPRAELKHLTEITFANNFVLADEDRLGVHFRKYRHGPSSTCSYMTHEEWKMLYRVHCDPQYQGGSRVRYWAEHLARLGQLAWFRGSARLGRALSRGDRG